MCLADSRAAWALSNRQTPPGHCLFRRGTKRSTAGRGASPAARLPLPLRRRRLPRATARPESGRRSLCESTLHHPLVKKVHAKKEQAGAHIESCGSHSSFTIGAVLDVDSDLIAIAVGDRVANSDGDLILIAKIGRGAGDRLILVANDVIAREQPPMQQINVGNPDGLEEPSLEGSCTVCGAEVKSLVIRSSSIDQIQMQRRNFVQQPHLRLETVPGRRLDVAAAARYGHAAAGEEGRRVRGVNAPCAEFILRQRVGAGTEVLLKMSVNRRRTQGVARSGGIVR